MRHLVAGKKLNADTQHRLAMRRNLARSLFRSGRVSTTLSKAKAAQPFVEKLITRARRAAATKEGDRPRYVHHLRLLRRDLPDRVVLHLLVDQIAPLCKDRPGGYTRILHLPGVQLGDGARRAILEFVDRPELPAETKGPEREEKPAKKGPAKKRPAAATARREKAKGTGKAGE